MTNTTKMLYLLKTIKNVSLPIELRPALFVGIVAFLQPSPFNHKPSTTPKSNSKAISKQLLKLEQILEF